MVTRRLRGTKLVTRIREMLMEWGWIERPRFYLNRHPVGAVRGRLQGRGSSRRFRRVSLQRLLRNTSSTY